MILFAGAERTAFAQAEAFFSKVQCGSHFRGGGEGAEVTGAVIAHDAAGGEARKGLGGVGFEGEIAFVVAQKDVEARTIGFDEMAFGKQGLGFGSDNPNLEVFHMMNEAAQFGRGFA